MKKLINQPDLAVAEMLEGMLALNPGLAKLAHHNVLVHADAVESRDQRVALISGGGSGHEPAHAGYIGDGMLTAAVAGAIFTSPSSDSIFAAIRAVAGKKGALLIVKNYTGDRLNFGLASEMARAEGIPVKMVLVADDVALTGGETAGARGLAGTVLVHKIAGAAAAEGRRLEEVHAAAQAAADSIGTMGVSLSAGTSPATGQPSFVLQDDEMELGLGIHGEPGVQRTKLLAADPLTDTLITKILAAQPLADHARLVVLVNSLGATTPMELAIIARRALANLEERGFQIERMYAGSLLTSLDAAGISLSLLPVNDQQLAWLDAPTSAPAWPAFPKTRGEPPRARIWSDPLQEKTQPLPPQNTPQTTIGKRTGRAIHAACQALLDAEDHLTELDRIVGDGDLGVSMARGARALEAALHTLPVDQVPETLKAIGNTLRSELGGASGPLYGVFFLRAGSTLKEEEQGSQADDLTLWARALQRGCDAISELGGARLGDRTMLEALVPFAQALSDTKGRAPIQVLEAAAEAAERGATETAKMLPRRGRASYLGKRALNHPDPGAVAASLWLRAVVQVLRES